MDDDFAFLVGDFDGCAFLGADIAEWPSKKALVEMFRADGYRVSEGQYLVSLDDFDRFVFKELVGPPRPGRIDADNLSEEALIAFSQRVSRTLTKAGVRHRFEIYPAAENADMVAYFHYDWPKE